MHKSIINKKISIIVPIYNSENYLRKCVDSILKQTYSSLEILLIDDGSTDSSLQIINEYASNDDRVVHIHKENGGIGSAYKAAFEIMTGDYVLFVDSDDWLELDAIEKLLLLAIENNADFVAPGMRRVDQYLNTYDHLSSYLNIDLYLQTREKILKTHFEILRHPTLARLYKRELLNELVLFEQNVGIDEMLTPQLLVKCNRAVYTSIVYYNVLVRHDSVCRSTYNTIKILQTLKAYSFIQQFMFEKIPEYIQPINNKVIALIIEFFKFCIYNASDRQIILENIKINLSILVNHTSIFKITRKLPLKHYLIILLIKIAPPNLLVYFTKITSYFVHE